MRNPELTRNLWLELTPHRLVAMPAILGLIFALASTASDALVPGLALGLFGAITVLWGAQLCSESLLEEFRQGTWDTQRLSAMGPWQLAWGKLLGAPVFAWYGGAICLGVFAFTADDADLADRLTALLLGALALALLLHALGALLGLAAARSGLRMRSSALLVAILILLSVAAPAFSAFTPGKTVAWFGFVFPQLWFFVVSLWLFAAWGVVGLWRLMCRELQLRKPPTAWLGFAAFLTLYLSGLAAGKLGADSLANVVALTGFGVSLTMSYAVVLFEPRDFVSWRRIVLHWQTGNTRRLWEDWPCWVVTLPLALLAALWLALQDIVPALPGLAIATLPVALCLFALRDIALLHFFGLGKRPQRAVMATLIYLGLLYWLIPGLLGAAGLGALTVWLRPSPGAGAPLGLVAALLNAVAGVGLVAWRWQRRLTEMAAAAR